MLNNPDVTTAELMKPSQDLISQLVIVMKKSGIRKAAETGKCRNGSKVRRLKSNGKSGKERIIVTELPYMVNKQRLKVD